ncbi:ATP-binding protein [Deinococcus sp. QL22]|uniref:sensor histidine kinase n=1 Tax=Deinococcus sp. QL22 TaxID=2939437 RepID=UPI002017CF3D|nr:ATP-binding protein [Deinococcus sp. QL22]UQN10067.1 ATP-binding protein [Deinococcus sp. QL22]
MAEAGATLQTAGLPVVRGDLPRLTQLFQNLLGNAIKFRQEGTAPEVGVSAEREGTFWHFRVTDNGIGIEPEAFEQVFVMFKRLHACDEYQDSGLGLSTCQCIVEDHGGRILGGIGAGSGQHLSIHVARRCRSALNLAALHLTALHLTSTGR